MLRFVVMGTVFKISNLLDTLDRYGRSHRANGLF